MSVWRRTKANAARRAKAVLLHRAMQAIIDRAAARMHEIVAEREARLTLCFDLASPDADRAEVWPWSAYAGPPAGDPFWRRDSDMYGFNCAGQIRQMGGPPQ